MTSKTTHKIRKTTKLTQNSPGVRFLISQDLTIHGRAIIRKA
jgi:hypothetical protein